MADHSNNHPSGVVQKSINQVDTGALPAIAESWGFRKTAAKKRHLKR